MELRNALKSDDPEAYESSLPVHQDGTCNGLQHYAALGGDIRGAKQVNLDVTDRPSDVYTFVAEMVEKTIAKDAAKGEKYAQMLAGKISRKVVKQTVMTTVYGVTFIGARAQIEKQLKDGKDIPEPDIWGVTTYLAKQVSHRITRCSHTLMTFCFLQRPSQLLAIFSRRPKTFNSGSHSLHG